MEMQKTAGNGISTRQQKAIRALMVYPNVRQAAAALKIGERTIYTWLKERDFQEALSKEQAAALDSASRRLTGILEVAIERIAQICEDSETPAAVRLSAAKAILEQALKLRETLNFEERLSALEAKQSER